MKLLLLLLSLLLLLLLVFTAASVLAVAQDKPVAKPNPSGDSAIPVDLRARWWRAVAEQADAQAAAQQKAAASQSIVEEMTKFCGDRTLIRNAKGEPDCAATEKPAEKKP